MKELFLALPKLLDEFEDNPEVQEAVVFAGWRKTAGRSLCEHAFPFRLFGKHLVVAVADLMWKRHLELLSGQMIYKLNSVLGREIVTFIEFRIDEKTVLAERAKLPPRQVNEGSEAVLRKITPKLRRAAGAIKDEDLRDKFLLAASSCLARRDRMQIKKS